MKKILLSFVSVALLLMMHPNTIYANENVLKEEIVYGRMNQDGTIDCIFVVNAFDVEEKSDLMDYGSYLEVINTTTNQPISFNGIFSSIEDVEKGRFFYQG